MTMGLWKIKYSLSRVTGQCAEDATKAANKMTKGSRPVPTEAEDLEIAKEFKALIQRATKNKITVIHADDMDNIEAHKPTDLERN